MNDKIQLSSQALDELIAVAVPLTLTISREALLEAVRDLLRAGRKIYAIKIVRSATGHGLLLAKTIVDVEEAKINSTGGRW